MNIMKKLITCIGLILLTQVGFAQDAKIGVINLEQALFNSDAARIVQEELQQEFSSDEDRAQTLSEELIALQEKFQQDQAIMSEEEIRRMNSQAQDLQVQLQLIQERVQQALQERNQIFVEEMREELAAAVNDVVAEGGYDLVLNAQSVAYMAPVLDISAKVTAKLNENVQVGN